VQTRNTDWYDLVKPSPYAHLVPDVYVYDYSYYSIDYDYDDGSDYERETDSEDAESVEDASSF
jgi:hypothetical protein